MRVKYKHLHLESSQDPSGRDPDPTTALLVRRSLPDAPANPPPTVVIVEEEDTDTSSVGILDRETSRKQRNPKGND